MTAIKQFSFAAGEVPPSLYARTDQQKYSIALRTLRNAYTMRTGGAANRGGTVFVGEVKDVSRAFRLIDFIFSNNQAYALEFGHEYIRVILNGVYITESEKSITGITNANPGVFSSVSHGYSVGDELFIDGILGMAEVNNRNWRVASVIDPNNYTLEYLDGTALDTTSFGTYISGGNSYRVFTITTPFQESELFELQYTQSADVMTIVHKNHDPQELRRTGHTSWTITAQSRTPQINPPGGFTSNSTPGTFNTYQVTSFDPDSGEESIASAEHKIGTLAPSPSAVQDFDWVSVSGVERYGVYRKINGVAYFVGFAGTNRFRDDGITPDFTRTPPISYDPFAGTNDKPSVIAYVQERLVMGNTNNDSEIIHGSRSGLYRNFTKQDPIGSSSKISFRPPGRTVNEIRHLIDLKRLVILTSNGEWSTGTGTSGALAPGEIFPTQHGYNGSSKLRPILVGETILYVQSQGSKIRDLFFQFSDDGYVGNEISIWGEHLIRNRTIVDWDFEKEQSSIIWAVMSDGDVVGITYVKEQRMVAFHRHDFQGDDVETVTAIPENGRTAIYFGIKRTINGRTVRYVERMEERDKSNVEDHILMDSTLTYSGWNTDESMLLKISGGTGWTPDEILNIESNFVYFDSSFVGKQIHFKYGTKVHEVVKFEIKTFVSSVKVTGNVIKDVPSSLQDVFVFDWALAANQVTGAWHLEGKQVSVFADGFVLASPNNKKISTKLTVTNGSISLDDHFALIHVGLPFISDLYSLDIDTVNGETLMDKKMVISKVTAFIEDSMPLWAGVKPPEDDSVDASEGLTELKLREKESNDEPVRLATKEVDITVRSEWNRNGAVFLRQLDPVPMKILSIAPSGMVPFRRIGSV